MENNNMADRSNKVDRGMSYKDRDNNMDMDMGKDHNIPEAHTDSHNPGGFFYDRHTLYLGLQIKIQV